MAVTAKLYGSIYAKAFNKEINFSSDTIKVALVTSTYTPNQDTHAYFSDVTNEASGTGYTAGGATLASKTVSYNATTNTQTFDAADTSWTISGTITGIAVAPAVGRLTALVGRFIRLKKRGGIVSAEREGITRLKKRTGSTPVQGDSRTLGVRKDRRVE